MLLHCQNRFHEPGLVLKVSSHWLVVTLRCLVCALMYIAGYSVAPEVC